MGLVKFLAKIGSPGMIAWNTALAYKSCCKSGELDMDFGLPPEEMHARKIVLVAYSAQGSKPQSEEKKKKILRELELLKTKSLIGYCFLCLKYEGNIKGPLNPKYIDMWFDVFDEKLKKHGVPGTFRYGSKEFINAIDKQFLIAESFKV